MYVFDPRLAYAATPPASWYYEAAMLRDENRSVFGRTWQLVGQLESVASPGDYFTATVGGEPILVVRDREGVLRAMSNVCRHRAGPVASGSGNARAFRCGYHGWVYTLEGALAATPEFEAVECFDKSSNPLPSYKVDVWLGQIFVNLDPSAPPLRQVLGRLADMVDESRYAGFRLAARKEWTVECNWKVYVDNYLEGYHIPVVHPGLAREIDYPNYRTETSGFFSIQHAPLKHPERIRTGAESDAEAQFFWLFPNLMLNVYPDNFSTNVIIPVTPTRTITLFDWYFKDPEAAEVKENLASTIEFSDEIQLEDIAICEAVQRGLESQSYSTGRYSVKRENGVHHFHGLLAEYLGADRGQHARV